MQVPYKPCNTIERLFILTRILVSSEMLFVENKIRPMFNIFTQQDKLTQKSKEKLETVHVLNINCILLLIQ